MSTSAPTTDSHPVTVAITRRVDPHDELLMQAWADAGTSMAQRFPGFLGSGWVRPTARSEHWHMLYRFETRAALETWESSRERQRWLAAGRELVHDTRVEHRSGIEGWFDEPVERTVDDLTAAPTAAPARWKQMIVIWTAFFPTSVLLTYLLADVTHTWPVPLRVLLTTVIAVPVMTYVILPQVTRLYQPWLTRGSRARAR